MIAVLRGAGMLARPLRAIKFNNKETIEDQLLGKVAFPNFSEPLPNLGEQFQARRLEPQEIETRIMKVLHGLQLGLDLEKLDWEGHYRQLGLDSLQQTLVLTSIEHEFTTVFEDSVFDNLNNLNAVVRHLAKDEYLY
jgi:acyl carrier protein